MRMPFAPALLAVLATAAFTAGCNRDEVPADVAPISDAPAASDDATDAGDDAGVTMRYACDGQRVAVFGQDHASVTLADGREIDLAFAAGSSPPRFSGEALEFSVAADGAVLAQDEGASWTCTPE